MPLLKADPDLGGLLAESRRAEAERELLVRTHRLGVGPWDVSRLGGRERRPHRPAGPRRRARARADRGRPRQRRAARPGRPASGRGSRPSQTEPAAGRRRVDACSRPSRWRCSTAASRPSVARYPEITAALFDRLGERSLRLATTQAISQLTRVDRRLKALFWHLAERWGRVGGDGVDGPARADPPDPRPARRRAPADRLDRAGRARRARRARAPPRRIVAAARRPAGRRERSPRRPACAARASATCCAPPGASTRAGAPRRGELSRADPRPALRRA